MVDSVQALVNANIFLNHRKVEGTMKRTLIFSFLFLLGTTAYAACELAIDGSATLQFNQKELTTEQNCETITLTLKNTSNFPVEAMGHNWVLVETANADAVATDGLTAGLANNYLKPNDDRVLANTKMIGGGKTTEVKFKGSLLKAGGDYTFLCTFPGHSVTMRGKLVVK